MTDSILRLTPRSAGAVADTDLLRVALTDIAIGAPAPRLSLGDRIRALLLRVTRPEADAA